MNQRAIPAVWMRGGTSKGLFFKASDLPADSCERDALLLRAIGSPDPFGKQIDGVGGATSSTSKIVILKPSTRPGFDVDYLFGHVSINGCHIDYSGNCGNLTTAVGVFAVEAGWVNSDNRKTKGEPACVRIWQENIGKPLTVTVPLTADGQAQTSGDYAMAGVPFKGARIDVGFLEPQAPDAVFPTGNLVDMLEWRGKSLPATLIDVGNPTVFINAADLGLTATETPAQLDATPQLLDTIETLRRQATVKMGLATSLEDAAARPATPKVALLTPAQHYQATSGDDIKANDISLCARIFSMGRAHHAFTGTGAVALGAAAAIPGTLVAKACGKAIQEVVIGHAAGTMDVAANVTPSHQGWQIHQVTLARTARTLMRGEVMVP